MLALAVAGDRAQRPLLQFLLDTARLRDASLAEAEEAGRVAAILRWFALQYAGIGGVTIEKAAALEQAAAQRVVASPRGRGTRGHARPLPFLRPHLPALVPALRALRPEWAPVS